MVTSVFETRLNRRGVVAAVATGAATLGISQIGAAQTTSAFQSGGLGLTREELEEQLGPGEQVDVPGHPIYDSTYSYGTQLATFYVWYMGLNNMEIAAYIEMNFTSDAVPASDARTHAERFLPVDARFSELYLAPATPTGPTALEMTRYISDSLVNAYDGLLRPEILMMIHEPWEDSTDPARATAVSLMLRTVTQSG